MKFAVIDIGSNTIRLCIYQYSHNQLTLLINKRVMALLGSKTHAGALTQEGIEAVCEALVMLQTYIAQEKAQHILVFATAALRNISNTEQVVTTIRERTGFCVDVLSGEAEALLTFQGAAREQNIDDGVIADIGGGSTEIILVKKGRIQKTESFPIGSLTAFVRFVGKRPATEGMMAEIRKFVCHMLSNSFSPSESVKVLYGIGGAARTAAELEKILYPGSWGAMQTLETLLARLIADEKLAEKNILLASPERLDTALPGVAILCEIARFFGCRQLEVCGGGVREGYLYQYLEAQGNR
ncbi:MAG: hypothetical protein E7393_00335 [Ruminococcaceae bacterium]|nr:hypothetical protein [Oscillospiraceae bacterium]